MTSPGLTRLPRSTLISASRPATFMPSTICSSAARVPAATTTAAARSSPAGTTRTWVVLTGVSARADPLLSCLEPPAPG
jgi:hypothetical protein